MTHRSRRGRRLHAVAWAMAAGMLCRSLVAVEGTNRPEVVVDSFRLEPMANYITSTGRSEFHPKGLLGFGFDSNVYAEPDDETGDGYVRALAGIEGRIYPGIFDLLVYDLELEAKIFFQEGERNLVGGGFDGEWVHEGVDMIARTTAHWARIDDPLVQTGERIQRSEYGGAFEFGRRGYRSEWVAEVKGGRDVYHEDARTFTAEQRSSWWARGGAGYTRDYSKTGEIRGEGYLDLRRYDESGRFNDSWGIAALGLWKGRLADRTYLDLSAGFEARIYDDDFLGIDAFDDQVVIVPIGTLQMRWQYEPFSRVDTQFYSRVEDATNANAAWIYGVQSEWLHSFDYRWRGGGFLHYYQIRPSGNSAGQPLDVRRTFRIGALCELELVRGIGGRARLNYTTSEAEISNDFDRIEIMVEAAIAF